MRVGVALAVAVLAFGVAFALARSGDDPEPRTVRGVQPAGAVEAPPAIRTPAAAGALPPLPRKPKPKPQPQPSDEPADSPAPSDTTPEPSTPTPSFTPPSNDGGGGGGGRSTPPPQNDPPPPPDSDG